MISPTEWGCVALDPDVREHWLLHYDEGPDLRREAGRSRMLIAAWGHTSLNVSLYARGTGFVVEVNDDDCEYSGGLGRSRYSFDDLAAATRFFAAFHWEEDEAAGNCAFGDPRCVRYVPPQPGGPW